MEDQCPLVRIDP